MPCHTIPYHTTLHHTCPSVYPVQLSTLAASFRRLQTNNYELTRRSVFRAKSVLEFYIIKGNVTREVRATDRFKDDLQRRMDEIEWAIY